MSKEAFREFATKLQNDVALQQELRKIGDPEKGIETGKVAAFAAGKGYKFSVEEMTGELSDDQLGKAAGGAFAAFQKADLVNPLFQKCAFNFSRRLNLPSESILNKKF